MPVRSWSNTSRTINKNKNKNNKATIDHSMWFHRPPLRDPSASWWIDDEDDDADEGGWLAALLVRRPHAVAHGVGAGEGSCERGSIFTRDGVLVASTAQEGLIRLLQQ